MERAMEDTIVLKSGRLFQQFVVDLYSMMESKWLSFIRQNQSKIRSDFLSSIEEVVSRGDVVVSSTGSRIVAAYQEIIAAIDNGVGSMFFVYGYGGTGKTFLWKTISHNLRSEGKIVLTVTSSGIASILLPGGRTARSQFGLPLKLTKESCCNIKLKSNKAELLAMTSLIIWDEAPMIHKFAFEAFERTLQDIMTHVNINNKKLLFGDFRQILSVVPKVSRTDIVHATINSSYLWCKCRVSKLTKNIRLQYSSDSIENEELTRFSKWILDVSDGKIGNLDDGDMFVDIPQDILVHSESNPIGDRYY